MRFINLFLLLIGFSFSLVGQEYFIYVTAESEDEVALVKFDAGTEKAETVKRIPVGFKPADIEGPHGLTVAPDGKHWFLSMAHGSPNGYLYKFKTGSDQMVAQTTLGLFPASMQISTATGFLFCVNFNLHGEMVPSSLSVVEPNLMREVTKIPVGTMPHGCRISADGLKAYTVGMMSGELFEVNTMSFQVERILNLDKNEAMMPEHYGMEETMAKNKIEDHSQHANHAGHQMSGGMEHEGMKHEGMKHSKVKPTWVTPHPLKPLIYVAGNGIDEVLEIDAETWQIINRMKTGKAPYNLDITPNGKLLIASYKGGQATGIWDLESHKEVARIENTRKVIHGVAVSPDSKFAFISVEGIGGEPGTVDVIDLIKLEKVGYTEIGKQAGGIAFWKMEP